MEPQTLARVTRASTFSRVHTTPAAATRTPLRAQLCLHEITFSGTLTRLQRATPSEVKPRVRRSPPQEPSRTSTDPEPSSGHIGSPSRSLASYLQRKAETCLQSRRQAGSVRSGLAAAGVGAWQGLQPALTLSSRRGPASAAGHLGSAPGARTAPDVVLMRAWRAEPTDA